MHRLGAGCRVPVSALARFTGGGLHMRGSIIDAASRQAVEAEDRAPAGDARGLGIRLAETLLQRGGDVILKKVRT
jgi:hydroxymethylbilane synthase